MQHLAKLHFSAEQSWYFRGPLPAPRAQNQLHKERGGGREMISQISKKHVEHGIFSCKVRCRYSRKQANVSFFFKYNIWQSISLDLRDTFDLESRSHPDPTPRSRRSRETCAGCRLRPSTGAPRPTTRGRRSAR